MQYLTRISSVFFMVLVTHCHFRSFITIIERRKIFINFSSSVKIIKLLNLHAQFVTFYIKEIVLNMVF